MSDKTFLAISLLVGAHFRPPAKQVLASLPAETEISLRPEPDNPYDSDALRAYISPQGIPPEEYPELEARLVGTGTSLEELLALEEIWLGFLPAEDGKPLAKAKLGQPELVGNRSFWTSYQTAERPLVELAFGPTGEPQVRLREGASACGSGDELHLEDESFETWGEES